MALELGHCRNTEGETMRDFCCEHGNRLLLLAHDHIVTDRGKNSEALQQVLAKVETFNERVAFCLENKCYADLPYYSFMYFLARRRGVILSHKPDEDALRSLKEWLTNEQLLIREVLTGSAEKQQQKSMRSFLTAWFKEGAEETYEWVMR